MACPSPYIDLVSGAIIGPCGCVAEKTKIGSVAVTLFVEATFTEDLNNKTSEKFQALNKTWCDMVRILVFYSEMSSTCECRAYIVS